ncbi:MAG: MBOAT family protein [Alphaproteobacteria bacterium]|jgi:D-alanyl-lipoteichoic acid acyltransferase DltB (MBOAT superfamily)|nr:MBOAT family protein [Alphaproteobacteria bacterium]
MLFNSPAFVFVFLPLVLAIFFVVARKANTLHCVLFLGLASLVFYGYWIPKYLVLILASIGGNFAISQAICRAAGGRRRGLLALGVAFNLGLLGYFKYALFLVDNAALLFGRSWSIEAIVLPLAISFFTFQQIAYLVDCWRGETSPPALARYLLFVAFFPQLIAGPIVHHYEMLPQFEKLADRPRLANLVAGMTIFFAGLFKKVILADGVSGYADSVFDAVAAGTMVSALEAWIGSFAFGFQIYFDFSGYSDMAIGLALMFGIRLPLNFASPYKAASIIDFWRRWHMTLSRFLREHLYFPLGGNRGGWARQMRNMMIVMLLGGLWHGAGWGFVLWGGLHGLYLALNHAWRHWAPGGLRLPPVVGRGLTMVAVIFAWVPFRAETWPETQALWLAMLGGGSQAAPVIADQGVAVLLLAAMLAFVWTLPNTQDWSGFAVTDGLPRWALWRKTTPWATFNAGLALAALAVMVGRPETQAFLYFQF